MRKGRRQNGEIKLEASSSQAVRGPHQDAWHPAEAADFFREINRLKASIFLLSFTVYFIFQFYIFYILQEYYICASFFRYFIIVSFIFSDFNVLLFCLLFQEKYTNTF